MLLWRQKGLCRSRHISYQVHARTTVPHLHLSSFHLDFATERASILSMLAYFNFFTIFLREATITGPIFTDHSNLLGVFNHVPHKLTLTPEGDLCIFRVLRGAWHLGALQEMFMNENPGIENKFYNKLHFPLSENCFRLKF